ncbi:MAG: hypothetical protein HQM00_16845, partial [Magnetococcales bacterium]|nr:hypothetical protein [Magnetococcales bacterium]
MRSMVWSWKGVVCIWLLSMQSGIVLGESSVRHCIDGKGRTILRGDACNPGERDRHPPPPDEIVPLSSKGAPGQYWIPVQINNRVTVEF